MSSALREENSQVALILENLLGTAPIYPTGLSLTYARPLHVAVVDSAGTQITGFGSAFASSVLVNQYKLTTGAVQLASTVLVNGVIFTALSTNTGNIFLGSSGVTTTADGTGNGYILEPGASCSAAVTNTNLFYAIGTAGDVLSWIGS